jgi:hypothetical protein
LSSGTFTNINGIIVGKTTGTTSALVPNTVTVGSDVTVTVPSGQVIGWDIGATVALHTDSDGDDVLDAGEAWITGTIKSVNHTTLTLTVVSKSTSTTSTTSWTLGYRGPRFHHDFTSGVSGLLIEEGRTNLLTWSEEFNNTSGWSQTIGGFATANQTTSPSGNNDADLLSARNTLYGGILRRAAAPAYAANTTYTMSVYAKAGTHQFIGLRLSGSSAGSSGNVYSVFTLSGSGSATAPTPVSGTINSVSCVSAGGGWYRCTLVYTTGSTVPAGTTDIAICQSNGNTAFTPAGTETVYLWGAQVEAGSSAASYIPTTTATVIRAADNCALTDASFANLYNVSEGTIILDCSPTSLNSLQGFYAIHGAVRSLGGHAVYSSGSNNSITAYSYTSNYEPTISSTVTGITSKRIKIAHAYKTNDGAISINGSQVEYDNTYAVPTNITGLVLGADGFANTPNYSSVLISDFKLYRKRISNDLMRVHSTL